MPFAFCPQCELVEFFDTHPSGYVCKSCFHCRSTLQRTLPEFESDP